MTSDLDDDLDGWIPELDDGPATADGQGGEQQRAPLFSNPEEFVVNFLAPLIRRRLGGSHTWCSQWWAHAEGLLRITALWETWEHFRHEGALGMSTWLLHHADPHLAVLLSKDNGPFAACKPDRHTQLDPLPSAPAPAGMWAAAAFSDPG
jgi:hypothetical protein